MRIGSHGLIRIPMLPGNTCNAGLLSKQCLMFAVGTILAMGFRLLLFWSVRTVSELTIRTLVARSLLHVCVVQASCALAT